MLQRNAIIDEICTYMLQCFKEFTAKHGGEADLIPMGAVQWAQDILSLGEERAEAYLKFGAAAFASHGDGSLGIPKMGGVVLLEEPESRQMMAKKAISSSKNVRTARQTAVGTGEAGVGTEMTVAEEEIVAEEETVTEGFRTNGIITFIGAAQVPLHRTPELNLAPEATFESFVMDKHCPDTILLFHGMESDTTYPQEPRTGSRVRHMLFGIQDRSLLYVPLWSGGLLKGLIQTTRIGLETQRLRVLAPSRALLSSAAGKSKIYTTRIWPSS